MLKILSGCPIHFRVFCGNGWEQCHCFLAGSIGFATGSVVCKIILPHRRTIILRCIFSNRPACAAKALLKHFSLGIELGAPPSPRICFALGKFRISVGEVDTAIAVFLKKRHPRIFLTAQYFGICSLGGCLYTIRRNALTPYPGRFCRQLLCLTILQSILSVNK